MIAKAERDPGLADDRGTCQLRPPETAKIVGGWVEAVFPVTHETRFCGSWKPIVEPDPGGGEELTVTSLATGEVVPLRRHAA